MAKDGLVRAGVEIAVPGLAEQLRPVEPQLLDSALEFLGGCLRTRPRQPRQALKAIRIRSDGGRADVVRCGLQRDDVVRS